MAGVTPGPAGGATPLREQASAVVDGCRAIGPRRRREPATALEKRLLSVVSSTADLRSVSDTLAEQARDWQERLELSTARANALRALDWRRTMTVLEVGARCGALTRFLGERCGLVDAVEPRLGRARVARERTRDLSNVEVIVGGLDDVPRQPAYDAVIAFDVLDAAGEGSNQAQPYVELLRHARALLREGGTLVLASANALGVKYLAGAPDGPTQDIYASVEGYPRPVAERRFSRAALTRMLDDAGFSARVLQAFPDHHLTRALLTDELFDRERSLAWRMPGFPSPQWFGRRARAIDEGALWRQLVDAGVGPQFGNSTIVLATVRPGVSSLWHEGRLAVLYQPDRVARFASETYLEDDPEGLRFERHGIAGVDHAESSGISIRHRSSAYVAGRDLLELLERADDAQLADLLGAWRTLVYDVVAASGDPGAAVDLMPHNVIVTPDGSLEVIDLEWSISGLRPEDLLARAALITGLRLANRVPPSRWAHPDVEGVVRQIGAVLELAGDDWLAEAIRREALFQAEVNSIAREGVDGAGAVERVTGWLLADLARPLRDTERGVRDHEVIDEAMRSIQIAADAQRARDGMARTLRRTQTRAQREIDNVSAELRHTQEDYQRLEAAAAAQAVVLDTVRAEVTDLRSALSQARDELAVVRSSRAWRAGRAVGGTVERLRRRRAEDPRGSD